MGLKYEYDESGFYFSFFLLVLLLIALLVQGFYLYASA